MHTHQYTFLDKENSSIEFLPVVQNLIWIQFNNLDMVLKIDKILQGASLVLC